MFKLYPPHYHFICTSTLPSLPEMLWFTFTLQNFSSRVSIPHFIIRFHPVYVYTCTCVYIYVRVYIVSSFFLKISPYSNILSSRDAPIHSPFRSPQIARRWTIDTSSGVCREIYFRVAIDNTRFTSLSRVDSAKKHERRCHDATSVAKTTPG